MRCSYRWSFQALQLRCGELLAEVDLMKESKLVKLDQQQHVSA